MRSLTRRLLVLFAFIFVGLLSSQAQALSLYDDFVGDRIDEAKWQNLDVVQEIRAGKLVSLLRAAGPPNSNPGNFLQFPNPTSILSFQADVRLNAYSPPPGGSSRVRLRGNYYNGGGGTSGSDATGDVRAQLYLRGTSSGVDIRYNVYKCADSGCNTSTDVIPSTTVKSAALGEVHTLAIAWDGSVFTFTVDGAATIVDPRPIQAVVNAAPNLPEKTFSTQLNISGAGGEGYVAGDFDNAMVNGAAYDDFSGSLLDPAKWASLELVREVTGGRFVSKAAWAGGAGTDVRNRSRFSNGNIVTAVRADMTVTAFQSNNSYVQARPLSGAFYNDGASTGGNDLTGDMNARIRVFSNNGGPLTVEFHVSRCNDSPCNSEPTLFSDLLGSVNLGETHTLFLIWDGSIFTYGIDATTRTYDPRPGHPVMKPPSQVFKEMRTAAFVNTTGGHGYIAATFDNVYVNDQATTLSRLRPVFRRSLNGDVTAAGVGLRGTGTGIINLTGIPPGASIQQAVLIWATLGSAGTFTSPTLNGTLVNGDLMAQSDDPFWGAFQTFTYALEVTGLVSGNGSYTVAGLPAGAPPGDASEGATLAVFYTVPGAPTRVVTVNAGAVTLAGGRVQFYSTPLKGFVAADPPTGATLTFIVGDGQSFTPEYAGVNTTLLATNQFTGGNGNYWDTRTYDVSTAIAPGATRVDAIISTANDSLVWALAALSVPGRLHTHAVGLVREGTWYLDQNANGLFDGCSTDRCPSWGSPGDAFVVGDWNGDGRDKIGIYRNGTWYLDANGNGTWDGCGTDWCIGWGGDPSDQSVVGDWNGDGKTKVGIYRASTGTWYLDANGNGTWDGCGTDRCISWGGDPADKVVVGDWSGDGRTKIGIYRNGTWYLDYNGDGVFNGCGTDRCISWGGDPGDLPVIGNWDEDGRTKIGIYRNGTWYLDANGNGTFDGCATDQCLAWGGDPADKPVVGDWNGDLRTKVGIVRNGTWYLDYNGSGTFDGCGTDKCISWGSPGDTFVVGKW